MRFAVLELAGPGKKIFWHHALHRYSPVDMAGNIDEGAVIAWQERFNYDEMSAIQHAMNLKLQDKAAFFAEHQNQGDEGPPGKISRP